MEQVNRDWSLLRDFYVKTFDVDEDLVDLVASSDIILMCASGASNDSISKTLDVDIKYIVDILDTVLDFSGWEKDLPLNPYFILCNIKQKYYSDNDMFSEFSKLVKSKSDFDDNLIKNMYKICSTYKSIENRIEREWS